MAYLSPREMRSLPLPGIQEVRLGRKKKLPYEEFKTKALLRKIPETDTLDLYNEYLWWWRTKGGKLQHHFT